MSTTRSVFIEDRKLKRARAQHMVYKLKMILGSGCVLEAESREHSAAQRNAVISCVF